MAAAVRDENSRHLSLRLSEVLDDIGISERMVMKRRRACLLHESIGTITHDITNLNMSEFWFGSQSEGSTSLGLHSDVDIVVTLDNWRVIQDWDKWEPWQLNLLFIQDKTTAPGYCVLQGLRPDIPLPLQLCNGDDAVIASTGRVLLKNTVIHSLPSVQVYTRNGPARTREEEEGFVSMDQVFALPCKTWPPEGRDWLNRPVIGDWPTEELRRLCGSTGFFVVPVGSRDSEAEETEWRVSTSLAERYLMFSLNITQLRCYVLMKMVLKTCIKPFFEEGTLSSFMCKTVLFHCISVTKLNMWREQNFLPCFMLCLRMLQTFIKCGNCPHFITPGNNLMRGKHTHANRRRLLKIIRAIIECPVQAFLQIPVDDFNYRLQLKLNFIPPAVQNIRSANELFICISGNIATYTAGELVDSYNILLKNIASCRIDEVVAVLWSYLEGLTNYSDSDNRCIITASDLLMPVICTTLGTVLASVGIHLYRSVPQAALTWLNRGIMLKLLSLSVNVMIL